jgi:asparagine synthase (glutamine-hydrolysing)
MCGIAGGMSKTGHPPSDKILSALEAALRHRGPDGKGRHVADHVGLVHTRLAIIDPAEGAQPFVSTDGVAVVANGEIYNDLELRKDLNTSAYQTGSDNESILHLYLRYGTAFAKHLRGMYAVAVYDPRNKSLVLARDPFGIKPLYVADSPSGFWFASEPQALVSAGLIHSEENPTARDELLALQFTCGPETALRGIWRLSPGETFVVRDGQITERRRIASVASYVPAEPNPIEAFDRLWEDSIRTHRRSDVPYGVFLSGGTDSAAVVAAMAALEDRPVIAYTAGFVGGNFHDERDQAAVIAAAAGADHRPIEISATDFWTHLPAIVACMDDPVADYAIIPTYLLAKAAVKDVKVVLTGEGGDEVFAGYGRYRAGRRPWPFRKSPWSRNVLARAGVLREQSTKWRDSIASKEAALSDEPGSNLQKLQALDMAHWLPDDLLLKVDRCLMAHGVEGRVPFLDGPLAAFGFHLPDHDKIHGRLGKWTLRRWLSEKMPEALPFSRKRGFSVPVGHWIAHQGPALASLVSKQSGVAGCCDPAAVARMFNSLRPETAFPAWVLLFYALWHQCHILGLPHDGSVLDVLAQR